MSRSGFFHDILSSVFSRSEATPATPESGSFVELADALLSEHGEMSGNRLARGILDRFDAADADERLAFFELLATRFDINAGHAVRSAERYAAEPSAANLAVLNEAVEPRRLELLRRLNQLPGATVRLVRMREALLDALAGHPELARIDLAFRHLFGSWFNRGFLVLREIDWHTPANVLEKIIAYEAVHAIRDWTALRARLEPDDRRCFAFFHPAMPDEPLIFVEVALTRSSPETVREVLGPDRVPLGAHEVDTAVFYSISNCQRGLAGVSFGNFLIKQVAAELSRELPALVTFRTLSPVPGFMRWVDARLAAATVAAGGRDAVASGGAGDASGASPDGAPRPASGPTPDAGADAESGGANGGGSASRATSGGSDGKPPPEAPPDTPTETPFAGDLDADLALARRLADSEETVPDESERSRLRRLVAHYLVHAKRDDGRPLDPVARFHLGNGASLDEVLPEADPFRRARAQSAGAMVSYLYDLGRVEANHESYASTGAVVTSPAIAELLEPPRRTRRRA